jgi:hypothetical protein
VQDAHAWLKGFVPDHEPELGQKGRKLEGLASGGPVIGAMMTTTIRGVIQLGGIDGDDCLITGMFSAAMKA